MYVDCCSSLFVDQKVIMKVIGWQLICCFENLWRYSGIMEFKANEVVGGGLWAAAIGCLLGVDL